MMRLITPRGGIANRWYRRTGKAAFDRIMALLMLIVLAPIMLLIAMAVRVVLGPGVIFVQTRIGYKGIEFPCYKFRSMEKERRVSGNDGWLHERRNPVPSADDPRKTVFGGLLRRYGLDELPQLLNVLHGDMSLIGPRPELARVYAIYSESEKKRTMAKPGITGYWQVVARSANVDLRECVAIDNEYIHNISFINDVRILLRTPIAMLSMPAATESRRESV